jgi:hypothetical protein
MVVDELDRNLMGIVVEISAKYFSQNVFLRCLKLSRWCCSPVVLDAVDLFIMYPAS